MSSIMTSVNCHMHNCIWDGHCQMLHCHANCAQGSIWYHRSVHIRKYSRRAGRDDSTACKEDRYLFVLMLQLTALMLSMNINVSSAYMWKDTFNQPLAIVSCGPYTLWTITPNGFVPTMNIGGRFGLVWDRVEKWRKYLKLWSRDSAALVT